MTNSTYDLRSLIIKYDLENSLKAEGYFLNILNDQERIVFENYSKDQALLLILREAVVMTDLIDDIKCIIARVDRELEISKGIDEGVLEKIRLKNLDLLDRIKNNQCNLDNIYNKNEKVLLVALKS